MATDNVEICNSALSIIGTRKITSMSDPSVEGRECNSNYDLCRKAVLRDHRWGFASNRVVLDTPDPTPPDFGFSNRFPLPADFIRTHTVFDTSGNELGPDEFSVESGFILSDEGTLWLKYVYDLDDTTQFDPLFDNALAANLAAKIAYKITGSETRGEECQKIYMSALKSAKFVTSTEQPSERFDADVWLRARMDRGEFVRDPGT